MVESYWINVYQPNFFEPGSGFGIAQRTRGDAEATAHNSASYGHELLYRLKITPKPGAPTGWIDDIGWPPRPITLENVAEFNAYMNSCKS